MRRWARALVVAALALFALAAGSTARAADPPSIVIGADGETAPVFSYANAIRERVFIPVPGVDQDGDGVTDQIAIDIVRPAETEPGPQGAGDHRRQPVLHVARARQRDAVHPHDAPTACWTSSRSSTTTTSSRAGTRSSLAHAIGTAFSTGCPLHGGPGDVAGFKAVIDWLRGRDPGLRQGRQHARHGRLGQRQERDDRQVLRRHVRERRRRDRRRRADDDRPDLGDLRLVRLLARWAGSGVNTHYPRQPLGHSITAERSAADARRRCRPSTTRRAPTRHRD